MDLFLGLVVISAPVVVFLMVRRWRVARRRVRACACGRWGSRGSPNAREIAAPSTVATLVHGTFARHAPWMQPGAALTDALESGSVEVHRFCWSGRNRQADRFQAATELRSHLTRLVEQHPEANHVVVAHSHGGNVALYAVGRSAECSVLSRIRVVTLATPFIAMRRRDTPSLIFVAAAISMAVLAVRFFVALANGSSSSRLVGTAEPGWTDWAFSIGLYSVSLLVVLLIFASAWLYSRAPGRPAMRRLLSKGVRDSESRALTVPEIGPDRLAVIRSSGDEATGLLAAAQLASWLASRIVAATDRLLAAGMRLLLAPVRVAQRRVARIVTRPRSASGVILSTIVLAVPFLLLYFASVTLAAVALGLPIMGLSPIIAIALLLANLPFGVDMLFLNLFGHVTAESSPPGVHSVTHISHDAGSALAHGVYDQPAAIGAVLDFVGTGPRRSEGTR